ncbi:membrane progestin receptor gamma isoform X2 [Vulpes vulpes]|uniref:Membrane progestin receptor gamma isoform X2 n=1 Tax=Vulpes vulpes TaxID=9627 RepID=A0ABM4YXT1_VULVU
MLSLKLPRLFSIDQIPQVFHEQGILFGYRHPQSSATACVLSLFQMTNETLNIWTHLLPFWFFVWRFVTALYVTDIQNDSYSWPLFVYMGTSCVYPLASSCAHTFSSMSRNARHICYFLDYGAVNLFSLGSAIAYSAYSIPDVMVHTTFHDYYVTLAVLNTIISTGLSCYSRLGFADGEAGSFAPGEALYQAGRNVVSSHRKSMVWGMALASQSQLSSCILFIYDRPRERGRVTGRRRGRLHAGSPTRDSFPGLQDRALGRRQAPNRWTTQGSPAPLSLMLAPSLDQRRVRVLRRKKGRKATFTRFPQAGVPVCGPKDSRKLSK